MTATESVATKNLGAKVEIRIRDNGIPLDIREKIFIASFAALCDCEFAAGF
jgi:hypothetical protein